MNNTVKTTFTEDSLVNFKRFTLVKKSIIKPAVMYILCLAVIVCTFIYNGRFELNFKTILYPSLAIICGVIVTIFYYIRPKKDNEQLIGKEVEYTFADDGVSVGEINIPYSDFVKVYEDNNYFYFYVTDNDGFFLNKESVDFDLKALLNEKIENKKVLKLKK